MPDRNLATTTRLKGSSGRFKASVAITTQSGEDAALHFVDCRFVVVDDVGADVWVDTVFALVMEGRLVGK